MMKKFEIIFNNLNDIEKKSINAYRNARQFKNIAEKQLVILNDKIVQVIIASITNKVFACELFLKSIIIIDTGELIRGHYIQYLIEQSGIKEELKNRLHAYDFDNEIININNSFEEWRYVYERDESMINLGFLNCLCNELEELNRQKILDKYNLNMLESFL